MSEIVLWGLAAVIAVIAAVVLVRVLKNAAHDRKPADEKAAMSRKLCEEYSVVAMAAVAASDGMLHPDEIRTIIAIHRDVFRPRAPLTPGAVRDAVVREIRSQGIGDMVRKRRYLDDAAREVVLFAAYMVAVADGSFAAGEWSLLENLGRMLGYSAEETNNRLEAHARGQGISNTMYVSSPMREHTIPHNDRIPLDPIDLTGGRVATEPAKGGTEIFQDDWKYGDSFFGLIRGRAYRELVRDELEDLRRDAESRGPSPRR